MEESVLFRPLKLGPLSGWVTGVTNSWLKRDIVSKTHLGSLPFLSRALTAAWKFLTQINSIIK